MTILEWSDAIAAALYGPGGFYRENAPDRHFRTSANAGLLLAESLSVLVVSTDAALDHPAHFDLVDIGAGDGRLLSDIYTLLPGELADRVAPVGVEVRQRPPELMPIVRWVNRLPEQLTGLVMAHEYLDNVPCDVAETQADGRLSLIAVDRATGEEFAMGEPDDQQGAWLGEWWPLHEEGDRAEIGIARDEAWAKVLRVLERGVGLTVDYGHTLSERASGAYAQGTLTGYRDGRQVLAVPDGSCDITAHVAIDACVAAGRGAGAETTALLRQADALRALGVSARRPTLGLAHSDPAAYIDALSRAAQAAELLDPASLGSFWWLLQSKGCGLTVPGVDAS